MEHSAALVTPALASGVARSLLAGEATFEGLVARATQTLERPWRFLGPLTRRYLARFGNGTRPSQHAVVSFLRQDIGFRKACSKHGKRLRIAHWLADPTKMQPVPAAASWNVPALETVGDLAAWLAISTDELDWFANLTSFNQHYHYRVLAKDANRFRIIEAPKPRLKELQRRILTGILELIPPHSAAHGFLKGHSIKTFIAPHVAQTVVLRMDLKDFFPSIGRARIGACFRTMGYPDSVATYLAALCTNAVPDTNEIYSRPHLPQGAPTSPALANMCTYRADCRLTGLAAAAKANYTRYADDLAFSGNLDFDFFSLRAAAILLEEGFEVHHRKTRIMHQGVRQHLVGLVANQHMNVMRPDFDRLKAILTNCLRHGPASQNRAAHPDFRAHLEGRVAFVESINPARGQRLRALYEQIHWP